MANAKPRGLKKRAKKVIPWFRSPIVDLKIVGTALGASWRWAWVFLAFALCAILMGLNIGGRTPEVALRAVAFGGLVWMGKDRLAAKTKLRDSGLPPQASRAFGAVFMLLLVVAMLLIGLTVSGYWWSDECC